MDEELWVEQRANAAYEAWRARGVKSDGRKLNTPSTPYRPPERPAGQINVTDPDSRIVQSRHGFIQGYTAQAVTTKDQIVISADVICGGNERMSLERLVDSTEHELERAGVSDSVEVALADAGFWNTDQIARLTARGIKTLVNPDSAGRKSPAANRQRRPHYVEMREQLASEEGKAALQPADGDDRARVRAHQVQPPGRSLPTKRPRGLSGGMEADHRHSQLIEALAPRTGTRPGIAGTGGTAADGRPLQPPRRVQRLTGPPDRTRRPSRIERAPAREPFTKQPPREAGKPRPARCSLAEAEQVSGSYEPDSGTPVVTEPWGWSLPVALSHRSGPSASRAPTTRSTRPCRLDAPLAAWLGTYLASDSTMPAIFPIDDELVKNLAATRQGRGQPWRVRLPDGRRSRACPGARHWLVSRRLGPSDAPERS